MQRQRHITKSHTSCIATFWQRLKVCAQLMRVHKPIGFFLLLWPTLIALWIAGEGRPDPFIVGIFIAGTFIMRSAGCVINDLFDQDFDGQVSRTRARPLVAGTFSKRQATALFIFLIITAFLLVLQLNIQTILFSIVAVALAIVYPLMKRITHLPQTVLGMAFAWSIPMAFMAIRESIPVEAWVLYVATLLWVIAYDTQYAMADREEDMKIGVKSTAILFGMFDKIIILLLQLTALLIFCFLGYYLKLGLLFFAGIFLAGLCMLYQQYLIKNRIPSYCIQAFLNNNYFGAFLVLGLWLNYYFTILSKQMR